MEIKRVDEGEVYPACMVGRPPLTPPTECGARLARLRKAAGLSQAKLAEVAGIARRAISFYEREASYIPSNLLPALAETLGVSVEELIGMTPRNGKKRGPKSKLERQLEVVRDLPRSKQQFVTKLLDQLLTGKA